MTRRPAKRAKVARCRRPWSAPFDDLFRIIGEDWKRPAEVDIRLGTRTGTFSADFEDEAGVVFRGKVKVSLVTHHVLEETLEVRVIARGKS